jgi:hypothetical protein
VTIIMDCDEPGRRAAGEIEASLTPIALAVEAVDLWPDRDDGYDLSDWLREHPIATAIGTGEIGATTNPPQKGDR